MDAVCEEILLTLLIKEFVATKALDFSLSDTFNTRHSYIYMRTQCLRLETRIGDGLRFLECRA